MRAGGWTASQSDAGVPHSRRPAEHADTVRLKSSAAIHLAAEAAQRRRWPAASSFCVDSDRIVPSHHDRYERTMAAAGIGY